LLLVVFIRFMDCRFSGYYYYYYYEPRESKLWINPCMYMMYVVVLWCWKD